MGGDGAAMETNRGRVLEPVYNLFRISAAKASTTIGWYRAFFRRRVTTGDHHERRWGITTNGDGGSLRTCGDGAAMETNRGRVLDLPLFFWGVDEDYRRR